MKFILVFNIGSSTIKYELFRSSDLETVTKGAVDQIFDGHEKAIQKIFAELKLKKIIRDFSDIACVGHRVVHGGKSLWKPTFITSQVIAEIKKLSALAPLHNPANLAGILACRKFLPGAKQIAVFDTGFHHSIPEVAFRYALPKKLADRLQIRRFGFHGISHEFVFHEAQKKLSAKKTRRTITCHLGNGCSITAILNGKSIDTSMGFTPLEGIPMGTRSGDIDPAIVLYLLEKGFSKAKIKHLLEHESGLLGLSGISSDMRVLWKKAQRGNRSAKLAIEIFSYRIAKYIASYIAALGGLDCIVFTGGIGENAWYVRKAIMQKLAFLQPKPTVLVIPTHEEKHIAEVAKKIP